MYPFFEANKSGDQNFFSLKILENFSFPPHLHPYVEIAYVIEGSIEVTINDTQRCLSAGEVSICFPNDIHTFNSDGFSKIILFIFSPDLTRSFFGIRMDKTLENPFMSKNIVDDGISSLLYMLHDEYTSFNNKYVIKGLLYTILGKLDSHFTFKKAALFITVQCKIYLDTLRFITMRKFH
ncbi:hypothetical protein B0I65_002646 [Clostridium beijerinckii]|uniref:cupin domain-containing protein n=1 Tax=Clostridium beijerinckii TaxID=1520 RepID=UPI001F4BE7C5|nr:cupin domain-containing protein [Clostridium beijerinckii]NRU22140.1 hypothetical protein [Clostridium beijerinckii]